MKFHGAADCGWRGLRQAEVAHLADQHQLSHRANRLLNGHVGIHVVLVVEVDVPDTESLQARVTAFADVLGPAIARGRRPCKTRRTSCANRRSFWSCKFGTPRQVSGFFGLQALF